MAGYDTLSSSEGAAGPSGAAGGGASTNLAAPGEALPGDYAYRWEKKVGRGGGKLIVTGWSRCWRSQFPNK